MKQDRSGRTLEDYRELFWEAEKRITELEAIAEKCGYPQEDGVEWYPLKRVRELEAEIEEVHLTGGCSYIRLNKAETRIKELQAKLDAVCEWSCEWSKAASWDDDTWESDCGAKWYLEAGGPKENSMNYCPQCGGKLVEAIGEQE